MLLCTCTHAAAAVMSAHIREGGERARSRAPGAAMMELECLLLLLLPPLPPPAAK